MAKSNPSLADLSRMRREARRAKQGGLGGSPHEPLLQEAVAEVSSVEAQGQSPRSSSNDDLQSSALREQEARQSDKAETVQEAQPHFNAKP